MSDHVIAVPAGRAVAIAYQHKGDQGRIEAVAAKAEERRALMERIASGDVVEVLLTAETYAQGPGIGNKNHFIASKAALASLARSGTGTPFQRNHSLLTEDTGGIVEATRIEVADEQRAIIEDIRLTEPWAVRAAVSGTMQKFSIHWDVPLTAAYCTACSELLVSCSHWPGDVVETRSGPQVAQALYKSAEWIERSWVVNPAIVHTAAKQWEALASARASRSYPAPAAKEKKLNPEITKALGLPDDADEAAVLAAVQKIKGAQAVAEAKLADAQNELSQAQALAERVAKLEADLVEAARASAQVEADRVVESLVKDGRIRVGSKSEALIREAFASSVEKGRTVAEAFGEQERVAPVGDRQSLPSHEVAASAPAPGTVGAIAHRLPEDLRESVTKYGADIERFLKHNPALAARLQG